MLYLHVPVSSLDKLNLTESVFLYTVRRFTSNEQAHEIMVLFVLCKLVLQTSMRSHPVGLDVWIFGQTLRLLPYFMCANSEGGCADSPEPSLVAYVISTIISWAGSNDVVYYDMNWIKILTVRVTITGALFYAQVYKVMGMFLVVEMCFHKYIIHLFFQTFRNRTKIYLCEISLKYVYYTIFLLYILEKYADLEACGNVKPV